MRRRIVGLVMILFRPLGLPLGEEGGRRLRVLGFWGFGFEGEK